MALQRTAGAHTGTWIPAAPFLAEGTGSADVVTAAVQQILGYGVLGAVALALAWIVYKGAFVPQKRSDEQVTAARADLLRENEQLRADKIRAEEQRDEALKIARDQVVPLLTTFNATVASLLPILQELARYRDDGPSRRRGA
jgi:hypothetical protein